MQKTPYGLPRQYVAERLYSGAGLELDEATAHHVARVLRMQTGDALVLFDGTGGEYGASIASIGKRAVRVTVGAHDAVLVAQRSRQRVEVARLPSQPVHADQHLRVGGIAPLPVPHAPQAAGTEALHMVQAGLAHDRLDGDDQRS